MVLSVEEYSCAPLTLLQRKMLNKVQTLDITWIDSSLVICIVIFAGAKRIPLYETGMDQFIDINGNASENDFFDKIGTRKALPRWSYVHVQWKRSPRHVPKDT